MKSPYCWILKPYDFQLLLQYDSDILYLSEVFHVSLAMSAFVRVFTMLICGLYDLKLCL